jgi:hypothetical protein
MDLIYMDKNGIEKGVLRNYSLDLDCGDTNDFQIAVGIYNNLLKHTDRFYIENTEYGGIIDSVRSDTRASKIYYSGRTWRGILSKKIIRPLPGDDYYVVSGEANAIIKELIEYVGLDDLFVVKGTTNIFINTYRFNRYTNLLSGINAMLRTANARLKIRYKDGFVELSAEPVVDYSDEIEFSQDNKINFIAEDNKGGVNHLICLGSGELSARQVVDLYVDGNGNIGTTQYYFGTDEIVETFDFPNAESLQELTDNGIRRLIELSNNQSVDINVEDMDLELGDIIAGREEITGLYISEPITQKIVRINDNITKIEYKVGD